MENIRLPEDFTDQVMRKIEVRERARTRRTRAIAVAGGILGGTLLSAAVALLISHHGMALTLPAGAARSHDIAGFITGFFSNISAALHGALAIPAGPVVSAGLAVLLLAMAGLWHDRRHSRHDLSTSAE